MATAREYTAAERSQSVVVRIVLELVSVKES
jgi:hypothetical protein